MHLDEHEHTTVFTKQSPLHGTVNEAEYHGFCTSLEALQAVIPDTKGKFANVYICTDSKLVVNQVNGVFSVNASNLAPLHKKATTMIKVLREKYPLVTFTVRHIPREHNTEADRLANCGRESKKVITCKHDREITKFTRRATAQEQKQQLLKSLAQRKRKRSTQQSSQHSQHRSSNHIQHRPHSQNTQNRQHRKRRVQVEKEKRDAAQAHLAKRIPNYPVPPSEHRFHPLQHVATSNTWLEIPDVAKQQFSRVMRELLTEYSSIPLDQRTSSRATHSISKILLVPSNMLHKKSSRTNAKAVRGLQRELCAYARDASRMSSDEQESKLEQEAAAAASAAASAVLNEEGNVHEEKQHAVLDGIDVAAREEDTEGQFYSDEDDQSSHDAFKSPHGSAENTRAPDYESEERQEDVPKEVVEEQERAARSLAFKIARAQQLYLRGYTSKAIRLLLSSPPISLTPQVIRKLTDLHPEPSSRDRPPVPEDAPNVAVDTDLLVKLLKKAANGSSRDACGWTAELLLALLDDEDCLAGLAELIQDILNNNLNEDSRQLLLMSKLIALQKANDPTTPRPIAIGGVFYKIAALYALEMIKDQLSPIFEGIQLGIGAPGGSARAIHSLQAAFDTRGKGATGVLFDQKNAFNSEDRSGILLAVFSIHSLSPIWNFVAFGYGGPSLLVLIQQGQIVAVILSQQGCKQGDPLGSLLYCIALMPKIHEIISVCTQGSHSEFAVVDDLSIVTDEWEQAIAVFDKASQVLNLNKHKTKFLWPHTSDPPEGLLNACANREVELLKGTAEVLGGMIGTGDSDFVDFAIDKVDSITPLFDILKASEFRAQIAVGLLRSAMNNKLGYLMRCLPPRHTDIACQIFDAHVQETFCHIHHLDFIKEGPEDGFLSLPKSLGGLNIAKSAEQNSAAYFCQAVATAPYINASDMADGGETPAFIIDREEAYQTLVDSYKIPTCTSLLTEEGDLAPGAILPTKELLRDLANFYDTTNTKRFRLNSRISRRIAKAKLQNILDHSSREVIAGFLSRMSKDALNWAFLTPKSHATSLSNSDWIQIVKFHLNRLPDNLILKCACGRTLLPEDPPAATHFRSCSLFRKRAVNIAHDDISRLCSEHAKQIGLTAGFSRRPRGLKKNVTTDCWYINAQGHRTDIDVTISHLAAPSYLIDAKKPGIITDRKEKGKIRKHRLACHSRGVDFVPFALETHGGIGNSARAHVNSLCQQALAVPYNDVQDSDVIKLRRRMLDELSVAIQRGNAKVMIEGAAASRAKGPTFYNFQGSLSSAFPHNQLHSNESSHKARLSALNICLDGPRPASASDSDSETVYSELDADRKLVSDDTYVDRKHASDDTDHVSETDLGSSTPEPSNYEQRSNVLATIGLNLNESGSSPLFSEAESSAPPTPTSPLTLPSSATSSSDSDSDNSVIITDFRRPSPPYTPAVGRFSRVFLDDNGSPLPQPLTAASRSGSPSVARTLYGAFSSLATECLATSRARRRRLGPPKRVPLRGASQRGRRGARGGANPR